MENNHKYTVEEIKEKLATSNGWLEHAVVALYRKQTDQEQLCDSTIEHNGRGYNGLDAEIMSSFARWIGSGRSLTEKQAACARKKIMKYAGQLTRMANGEG